MSVDPIEDGALLDAVRSVKWPGRRKTPGGLAGNHPSRVLGVSAEFTEYRAYRQGDDTHRIDWKLLARSDRAYIRLSNDRTVLNTVVLVDASGSLAYPAATLAKWYYVRHLAMGLAAAARRAGDPVGVLVATAQGPRRLPPRTRQSVVHEIARVLADVTPAGSPDLAPLLAMLRATARVAIVSDFLGDADQLLTIASQLSAAGREVHAVHVLHPDELSPPHRTMLLADPEQQDFKRPLTDGTRRRYLDRFGAWREQLARDWRLSGAFYTQVATSEPAAHAVRRVATAQAGR
jgi:uncharacterized protein (DUF58 family)